MCYTFFNSSGIKARFNLFKNRVYTLCLYYSPAQSISFMKLFLIKYKLDFYNSFLSLMMRLKSAFFVLHALTYYIT